jgi:hypothetical protein
VSDGALFTAVKSSIALVPGLRQKISGRNGHAQVGVLVDRGVPALDGHVVVRLVPEEEVVGYRHGEDGAPPGEWARASNKCDLWPIVMFNFRLL